MRRFPPLFAVAIALAGYGAADQAGSDVSLALRPPGAVDAGIYLATQRGFNSAVGAAIHPQSAADPLQTLERGEAGLAVVDIHELAQARARGRDVVRVMAVVRRPGVALRPGRVRRATQRAPGAPDYPELVLAALRSTITDDEGTVRGAVAALQRGYREAYIDPESAVQALTTAVPALRAPKGAADLDRLGPDFQASLQTYGELDPARLRAWAAWEPRTGLVKRPPDVGRAFDGRFVKPG